MLRPTLQSITKGFDKTVKQLDRLITSNNIQVEANAETIFSIQATTNALKIESSRANKIKDNISKILDY